MLSVMSPILVAIALVFHLFPFRTEKLSPTAPMVLRKRESRSPPSFPKVRVPSPVIWGRDAFWLAAAGTARVVDSNLYESVALSSSLYQSAALYGLYGWLQP